MSGEPVPLDLTRHAHLVEGARAFLRVWAGLDAERARPTDDPLQFVKRG